jgi:hypothetical protein
MTTVQGKTTSATRYRFHACLGYDEDEKQHLYSTHANLEEALLNSKSFMGLRYEQGKYIHFQTDDGKVLEPEEDYPMDYDALMGKEWYYEDQYHKYEEFGPLYPISKSNADLTKMMQEAIDETGRYIAEAGFGYFEITPFAAAEAKTEPQD